MATRPLLVLLGLLSGCSPPTAESPAPADATPGASNGGEIAWFQGSVEQAFAASAAESKPIFLYWGASWCPPCHQLKATVFARPDFIAKTQLFIPVYLDGDDEGAQKWGEQFRVTGYPTFVVLDHERREIMRISGGMDLNQYANILDLALADLQPVRELLATSRSRALSADECRRLAYNGWVLEDVAEAEMSALSQRLAGAAGKCEGGSVEQARLQLVAAYLASTAEAAKLKKGAAPSAGLSARVNDVDALLNTPAVALATGDALDYQGDAFFLAVKSRGAKFSADFLARARRVLQAGCQDARFAAADQLSMIGTEMQAERILAGSISDELKTRALARIAAALGAEQDAYARSGLINAALPVYDYLGMNEAAYQLVQAELPKAVAPYYFKADLAALAEELGRKDDALRWSAEAYAESRGAATRFQWGNLYVGTLLRLAPDDTSRIQQAAQATLGELAGSDRIYQRARVRLERLDKSLNEWAGSVAARQAVLAALRARMQAICGQIPAADAARASCDVFLARAA